MYIFPMSVQMIHFKDQLYILTREFWIKGNRETGLTGLELVYVGLQAQRSIT